MLGHLASGEKRKGYFVRRKTSLFATIHFLVEFEMGMDQIVEIEGVTRSMPFRLLAWSIILDV